MWCCSPGGSSGRTFSIPQTVALMVKAGPAKVNQLGAVAATKSCGIFGLGLTTLVGVGVGVGAAEVVGAAVIVGAGGAA